MTTLHVYRTKSRNPKQAWAWKLVARNGNIKADGSEGYSGRAKCLRALKSVIADFAKGPKLVIDPA